jgi:hypothetical protein
MPTAIGAPPSIQTVTITVANQALALQLDPNTVAVRVEFIGAAGAMAWIGSEGSPIPISVAGLCPADTPRVARMKPEGPQRLLNGRSLYVQTATVPTDVTVIALEGN